MTYDIIRYHNPDTTDLATSLELPKDVLSRTLRATSTAIECAQLLSEGVLQLGDDVYVSNPPYEDFAEASVRSIDANEVTYRAKVEGYESHYSGSIGLTQMWASRQEDLEVKMRDRRELTEEQRRLEAAHELGTLGSYAVINEFGGIDYRAPEITARHVALRGLIATQTGITASKVHGETDIGLLHPRLRDLMGEPFASHIQMLSKIFGGVGYMSESRRERFLELAFEEAVERSSQFVREQTPALELTVAAVVEPDLLRRVLYALNNDALRILEIEKVDKPAPRGRSDWQSATER